MSLRSMKQRYTMKHLLTLLTALLLAPLVASTPPKATRHNSTSLCNPHM